MVRTLTIALCLSFVVGCASTTERVDTEADTEVTISYDWSDIDASLGKMTKSLLASTKLKSSDRKYPLVAIGKVTNDTCQHFDTSLITEKIVRALLDSERFDVSATYGATAYDREEMIHSVRAARGEAEVDASTIAGKGQLEAPDFVLTGKVLQRNVRRDNGGRQVEYFLSLRATRLSDGVTLWQSSDQRIKRVANGMPVW